MVKAIRLDGSLLAVPLPLTGFAKANAGPPADPKVIAEQQQKLREFGEKANPPAPAANAPAPAPAALLPCRRAAPQSDLARLILDLGLWPVVAGIDFLVPDPVGRLILDADRVAGHALLGRRTLAASSAASWLRNVSEMVPRAL